MTGGVTPDPRLHVAKRTELKVAVLAGDGVGPEVTAGAMQDDRDRAFAAGMNDFLTKPVRADALSLALARAHAELTRNGS